MGLVPVQHHRAQALHEGERDLAQVVGHGALLLPLLGGHPPGQPPQLVHRRGVEPPEGLRHHRDEGDALAAAELARAAHLPVVGERERIAGGRGRAGPGGRLEGVDDSHVQGGVPAAAPARDEEVGRHPLGAGDEGTAPLDGARPTSTAMSKRQSQSRSCLLERSPPVPQQRL